MREWNNDYERFCLRVSLRNVGFCVNKKVEKLRYSYIEFCR